MVCDVSVPPRKRVEYRLTWEKVETDISFTAVIKLRAFASRLKRNGNIINMAQVDADGVKALLYHSGFESSSINIEGQTVKTQIKGSVHIDGATRGVISKYEYSLDSK